MYTHTVVQSQASKISHLDFEHICRGARLEHLRHARLHGLFTIPHTGLKHIPDRHRMAIKLVVRLGGEVHVCIDEVVGACRDIGLDKLAWKRARVCVYLDRETRVQMCTCTCARLHCIHLQSASKLRKNKRHPDDKNTKIAHLSW